ncbi:hypothetical protein NDU88_008899 [Pleurodeles waltl]|uniref:Uncharacterized protein n=1 Tax=Pleurodeles waltl TaxID=8319 RepID=A0AAV7P4X0_PLEWA|nr:hypothetical protein NDU88_008899 [Pleurodeles waltl]
MWAYGTTVAMMHVRMPEVPLDEEFPEESSHFREYRGGVPFQPSPCCLGCCAVIRSLCLGGRKESRLSLMSTTKKAFSTIDHTIPESKERL